MALGIGAPTACEGCGGRVYLVTEWLADGTQRQAWYELGEELARTFPFGQWQRHTLQRCRQAASIGGAAAPAG